MQNFVPKLFTKTIDENFLKKFSRNFYREITGINDLKIFENILIEWIGKNTNEDIKLILELMENHEQSEFWFSGIIGFFYQFGVSCDINKNKALELYILAVNNGKKELSDQNFKENDKQFSIAK